VILYRWRGASTNFGDELNTVLWPALLPDFFDDSTDARFMGIGSVLDGRHPAGSRKVVAGSGYGGYEPKPLLDESWIIHWVRGPRTAAMLGLPQHMGLGDPAILLPTALNLVSPNLLTRGGGGIGFMPHFESAERGAWRQAAGIAGIRLIDPRDPLPDILKALASCDLLLSEALHGVIVADAMRIPWIAIRPRAPIHRAKWFDWSATMDLHPRLRALPASTITEWAGASPLSAWHTTRTWLDRHRRLLDAMPSERLAANAASALAKAAHTAPQLSADSAFDRCRSRMLDAVQAMRAHPMRGLSWSAAARQAGTLRNGRDSAYQLPVTG
jgi:succinoglycan biosynthesis protein ExoV